MAPHEFLRLDSSVIAQPLLEDATTLTVGQAGQLPVDLGRDLTADRRPARRGGAQSRYSP
ncbi:hypothetical protein AB0G74_16655 [Streptomyces sp. NPDC020875]|uniref:hypothetical protein n=1 Tax=Streptomyces sp. NPDC020875 TaxID=3154898 RepID=UPI0033E2AA3E